MHRLTPWSEVMPDPGTPDGCPLCGEKDGKHKDDCKAKN